MIYLKNKNYDKSDGSCNIVDEQLEVGSDDVFKLNHDYFYGEDIKIFTAPGGESGSGTELELGIAFNLTNKNEKLSIETNYGVYSSLSLLKDDWNNTTLYVSYVVCADTIDADDINSINEYLEGRLPKTLDKIKFHTDDYLRIDDTDNTLYLDFDGETDNGKVSNTDKLDGKTSNYYLETTVDISNNSGADFNSFETKGRYRVYNPSANLPAGYTSDSDFFLVVDNIADKMWIRQVAYDIRSSDFFTRIKNNNVWESWVSIGSSGSVNNLAGVPAYATEVDPTGTTRVNLEGYFYATRVYNAMWNDLAEFMECNDPGKAEAGEIFVIDENGKLSKSHERALKTVVGVYSDTYGYALGAENKDTKVPIGLSGRVDVKIKEKCSRGDLLVSEKDGFASVAKSDEENIRGVVIGKALSDKHDESVERIPILIMNC